MSSMIKLYDILESELDSIVITSGNMICCRDTGNVYIDNTDNERASMAMDAIILQSENDRVSLLTPMENKIYCIMSSGRLYIYSSGWKQLASTSFQISNIVLDKGSWVKISDNEYNYTYNDSKISLYDNAVIVFDLAILDLAEECGINVKSVAAGSVILKAISRPEYTIFCDLNIS